MNGVKPLLAITMGDPAGVGPEICLQALHSKIVNETCRPIIFGDAWILSEVGEATGQNTDFQVITVEAFENMESNQIDGPTVLDFSNIDRVDFQSSVISAKTGKASYEYIIKLLEAIDANSIYQITSGDPDYENILQIKDVLMDVLE